MQTDQIVFVGSKAEQQLARDVWMALRMMGANYAVNAPIRQPLPALAAFFGKSPALAKVDDPTALIDAALRKNTAVFAREATADGVIVYVTTKAGRPPETATMDERHSLQSRLTEPAPARVVEIPVETPIPGPRVAEGWLRSPAGATPLEADGLEADEEEAALAPEEAVEVAIPPVAADAVTVTPPDASTSVIAEETQPEETEAVAPAAPVRAPEPPATVDAGRLREALRARLAGDIRLVSFGDEWSLDDQLMRLSRGDFRRIRDYLVERSEPLSDTVLLNDVFGRRVTDRDYSMLRFGLNQRLSKEKREFEFVGTSQERTWSTSSLPAIGTTKRKPAEIGQDYRFLLESLASREAGLAAAAGETAIEHSLTFYEYEYGVLPLDAALAAYFPQAYAEDQRAAVLTFDVAQLYTSYLVELRYPTANRGGFIGGLEQFYAENLVPGARITIERTDNDRRYIVRFAQITGEERRLLHLDERRGRHVFRPVTFFCAVNEDLLLSDTKFPGLNNTKPLDDKERRRPEQVVRVTFERVGDQVGEAKKPRYWALFDDLLAVVNVERPFTAEYLREILTSGTFPEFQRDTDENAFFYEPANAQ